MLSNTIIEAIAFWQKVAGRNLSLADHLHEAHFDCNLFAHTLPILSHQIVCDHYPELPAVELRQKVSVNTEPDGISESLLYLEG